MYIYTDTVARFWGVSLHHMLPWLSSHDARDSCLLTLLPRVLVGSNRATLGKGPCAHRCQASLTVTLTCRARQVAPGIRMRLLLAK